MCIAIYSPIGTEIPEEKYLKNSFEHNPHGAGFAFNLPNHTVQIEKGFMDYESFIKAFRRANRKYNFTDCGVLIHFRITTHGGTNPECTHPFPLVADEELMKKTKVRTNYAVIHNGIISLTSSETYKRHSMSDTMVFIEKYLSKIASNKKWFNNKANFELIYDLIDSKMAILNGYGVIHSTNGFTKDADGNWYSNSSYKEPRVTKKYSTYNSPYRSYAWYDDDPYESVGYYSSKNTSSVSPPKETVGGNTIKIYDSKGTVKTYDCASLPTAEDVAKAEEKVKSEPETKPETGSSESEVSDSGFFRTPLQMLQKGQIAEIDGFLWDYDERYPIFIDEYGAAYQFNGSATVEAYDLETDYEIDGDHLCYVGDGTIIDKASYRACDFIATHLGIFSEEFLNEIMQYEGTYNI